MLKITEIDNKIKAEKLRLSTINNHGLNMLLIMYNYTPVADNNRDLAISALALEVLTDEELKIYNNQDFDNKKNSIS